MAAQRRAVVMPWCPRNTGVPLAYVPHQVQHSSPMGRMTSDPPSRVPYTTPGGAGSLVSGLWHFRRNRSRTLSSAIRYFWPVNLRWLILMAPTCNR